MDNKISIATISVIVFVILLFLHTLVCVPNDQNEQNVVLEYYISNSMTFRLILIVFITSYFTQHFCNNMLSNGIPGLKTTQKIDSNW